MRASRNPSRGLLEDVPQRRVRRIKLLLCAGRVQVRRVWRVTGLRSQERLNFLRVLLQPGPSGVGALIPARARDELVDANEVVVTGAALAVPEDGAEVPVPVLPARPQLAVAVVGP